MNYEASRRVGKGAQSVNVIANSDAWGATCPRAGGGVWHDTALVRGRSRGHGALTKFGVCDSVHGMRAHSRL